MSQELRIEVLKAAAQRHRAKADAAIRTAEHFERLVAALEAAGRAALARAQSQEGER
jgi:hypothetical protein